MELNNEGTVRVERTVRLTSKNGTKVTLSGNRFSVDFDWFEEGCCIDCEIDFDASRRSFWTELWTDCPNCGRNKVNLHKDA